MRRLSRVAVIVSLLGLAHVTDAQGLTPYPPPTDAAALELGLALAADDSLVYPTRVFATITPEIRVRASLSSGKAPHAVSGTWLAVAVPGLSPDTVLGRGDQTPHEGDRAAYFRLPGPFRVGTYRFDVVTDGTPWPPVEFTVTEPMRAPEIRRPEDLLPLRPGTRWTYTRVSEQMPATSEGTPGKEVVRKRETLTWTVRETDDRGARAERAFDGAPGGEQWWRLSPAGLQLTAARAPGQDLQPMDPPKVLWAFPLGATPSWQWRSARDPGDQKVFRTWGAVQVQGVKGTMLGYVVLVEWSETWPEGVVRQSVERHYVPGIGLVREIHVAGTSARFRIWRNEMTLTDLH